VKVTLDKYARDARAWRDFARRDYSAALYLLNSDNVFLYFTAGTLAHHALEMYLKAALICEGLTVVSPKLAPSLGLKPADCLWGHNLVWLAIELSKRRPEFDVSAELNVPGYVFQEAPMMLKQGFELFDPFFSELRYPQELQELDSIGKEEGLLLQELFKQLEPFVKCAE
jgi:hypothetical protein